VFFFAKDSLTEQEIGGGQVRWDGEVDGVLVAHRGCEVVRGGGGEMIFLNLWMGLWL
jgi:hypothetical protein